MINVSVTVDELLAMHDALLTMEAEYVLTPAGMAAMAKIRNAIWEQ